MLARLAEHLDSQNLLLQRVKQYGLQDSFLCAPLVEDFRGRRGRLRGRMTVLFSLCSYLGLDQHPEIKAAAHRAIERYGMHLGCSRPYLDMAEYRELEADLADFVGAEAAMVFPTTTLTHHGVLGGIAGEDVLLLVDLYAHRSIAEAAALARGKGAEVAFVPHDRPEALESKLRKFRHRYKHALMAIDGIYSMTGRHHDLAAYQRIAREYETVLYMDDAHGFGVMGGGRGLAAEFKLDWDNLLYVAGLSKAMSSMGAFVAGNAELLARLRFTAPTQLFSGPIPIPNLFTLRQGLSMLREEKRRGLVATLWERTRATGARLQELGWLDAPPVSPIMVVPMPNNEELLSCSKSCLDQGVYFSIATYPAVPRDLGGLRILATGAHTAEDIDLLGQALGPRQALKGVA